MIPARLNSAGRGNGLSLNRMIGLSLFIHAIALSLLIFSPSLPAPKWTFGPVYSVQLVNVQDLSPKSGASTALSREVRTPAPAPRPIARVEPSAYPAGGLAPCCRRRPARDAPLFPPAPNSTTPE